MKMKAWLANKCVQWLTFILYLDKSTAATAVISQQTKMRSRLPNPLILCLILGGSFAMDGCKYPLAWRCGDLCIGNENFESYSDHCNCGGNHLQQGDSDVVLPGVTMSGERQIQWKWWLLDGWRWRWGGKDNRCCLQRNCTKHDPSM